MGLFTNVSTLSLADFQFSEKGDVAACPRGNAPAKVKSGMADYQVRKWKAWHHHMALVMMAMLFMLTERIRHEDAYPLLSCSDIEELLSHFLPRRDISETEVIRQLQDRHRRRQSAIEAHSRIQRKAGAAEWVN